ncbi:MAG: DEAD/DEAH box helicase [Syntrophobacteraceae bacterium]|nr:DEAD/DEAH box helicase [Syntrophobacteraceae bacterium]
MTSEIISPLVHLPNTYRAFFGGFSCLHPIQSEAVAPVLAGRDVVLQSATGSGKTEAVLAPCIERVIRAGHMEAVLYVVPTRALASDLERRFTPILTQRLGIRFGIRTGDKKRRGGSRPDLILTTPESLDVLTGSSNPELQAFLHRVRMVIVDEVHPFLNQYRGRQLSFLLRRLERRTGCRVQKIALSATISDADAVIGFFGFRVDAVRLISAMQRHITPNLVHLKGDEELPALLDDLYRLRGYRKILLFANSRGKCDQLLAITSRQGPFRGIAELHYSNLKPMQRRTVEDRFRRREQALCIATSTLELGIDIGDVDCVLLFEPPDSVSSFLQRIGRSNRRQSTTHFWGICRGERPGEQLLRFLGLMQLARQGIVEAPLPNAFPSVLVQQVLSCLYEKKGISPASIRDLFAESSETIDLIFPEMEKQGYLRLDRLIAQKFSSNHDGRPHRRNGLFRGGWRYREAFLDRGIWSNFPETEQSYALEVSGEAVADLPRSIVRQLGPGDCVNLAGKPVRILEIVDSGERKRVTAESTEQPEGKEIYWLGAGFQVTFEVAQAMRAVLNEPEETEEARDSGLFARSLRLLRTERGKNGRVAILANGIEVLRETGGFFRYRTFLGSMGNLILRFTAAQDMAGGDDFFIRSDEIGITCSHWINFRKLSLPVEPDQFRHWAAENIRPLRLLLPLNVFADALPEALLVEELTGFLHDSRVSGHFKRYLSSAPEIISGDIDAFELSPVEPEGRARVFEQSSASTPLLE